MAGLTTGAVGLWGGFAGLLYGSTSLSTPPGLLADAAGFSPLSLFAAGERGGWYDPSGFSTLFQDSAGTTPVTAVEQPVGLVLDKSRGLVLGPELVANGDFSSATGWSTPVAGCSITGGAFVFDGTTSITAGVTLTTNTPTASIVAGKTYAVTFTIVGGTTNNISIGVGGATTTPRSAAGTYTEYLTAGTNAAPYIVGRNVNGIRTGSIDNISVKELPGNHLSQSTSTARPVLSARVNLLTYTEQFDNAAWTTSAASITANSTTAPNGTTTADTLVSTGGTGFHFVTQSVSLVASNPSLTGIVHLKKNAKSWAIVHIGVNDFAAGYFRYVNLNDGSLGAESGTGTMTVSDAGNGWYRVTVSAALTASATTAQLRVYGATGNSGGSYTGPANDIYLWGADLRVSNAGVGLPAYQRVGAATYGTSSAAGTGDYDADPALWPRYLRFDGTDDSFASSSIDFSATDKMAVFAGVRKLSDAASGTIVSLGTYVSGNAFELQAPTAPAATTYQWAIHGNGTNVTDNDFNAFRFNATAPTTNVISATADRSIANTTGVTARNNGADASRVATTLTGTNIAGNFANAALSVGQRSTPTNRLNGHIYGLVIVGRALTAAEISNMETWLNNKTKAF